ncbi:MAG: zinc-ribbon domain-containing protein [Candidatus Marinimicrobia bacterium]|nr:zinc-ribbon domain-containing protein [Candidatus Neomarinimicrobiota bacterium]
MCYKCNNPIQGEENYCPNCGEALENKCSNCGSQISGSENFCSNCGQALKSKY